MMRGESPVGIQQDVGGLDVVMHEPMLVDPAQRRRDRDGNAQEGSNLHRTAQHPLERPEASVAHRHCARCLLPFCAVEDRGMELTQQALIEVRFRGTPGRHDVEKKR